MEVTLIDHMGTDLSVVNAARVSFAKKHDEFNDEKDARLIRYLAKHGHWTPFGHTSVTLHIKAPIFIARQLVKHQVGLVWNEVSRRYVDSEPEFYYPEWREKAESVKQGSGGKKSDVENENEDYECSVQLAKRSYERLLAYGVCPEQARMVLPQSTYTEWYWTGSIAAFSRVYKQRIDSTAQLEVQEIAKMIDEVVSPLFPVSWEALKS